MYANVQFSRTFLADAVWPWERTLIAFVKIAGKTLLDKEFRGISWAPLLFSATSAIKILLLKSKS